MAYVIFGDSVKMPPSKWLPLDFFIQGAYYDYIMRQTQIILENDDFARLNLRWKCIRPQYGYRYPEIPDEPFRLTSPTVLESLPPIFKFPNITFVNAKARKVLESVEPGVHQYIPIEFVNAEGGPEFEPYWMVNVCTRLVATNLELSNITEAERVDWSNRPDGRYTKFFGKKMPCMTSNTSEHMILKLNKDVIAGRAIWCEWKMGHRFMTDAFVAALRGAGIDPEYAHEAFHAEEV